MQSNGEANGHGTMNLQFVNETEAVISESLGNDYTDFGVKRGMDSDTDSEDSKRMGYDRGSDSPSAVKTGKKTKGRVKIKMEFIENKLRRYTTFSKRKTGIMKKAYELSTLTGTQVMLLVASETGHVYTFATKKLQPMITSESGKALIQTCLNSPDGVMVSPSPTGSSDQRMNPTGFEETELSCGMPEDEQETLPNKPVSSSLITSSTPPIVITPQSVMSTVPSGQQCQQPSLQLQPPPAHMGIQSTPTHTQPPQAHTGAASTGTVSSTATSPRTVTMMSYITSSQQLENSQNNSNATKSGLSMQLPAGSFTILPSNVQAGTQLAISGQQTLITSPQRQQSQQNTQQVAAPQMAQPHLVRIQPPTGPVITVPGLGQMSANSQTNVGTSNPIPATTQRQLPPLQQPVAVVSGTTSSSAAAVVYQTPQGLLYAAPSNVSTLPEGYVINLAASQGINLQQDNQQPGGSTQQYITIPVPVSLATGTAPVLQPMLSQTASAETNRIDKDQK